MRSTFNLKERNKNGLTSIRLIVYFKNENTKLIYSTGERIHPEDWDFESKRPKYLTGRNAKAMENRVINTQIERYSNFLTEITNTYKLSGREILKENIKKEFDIHFKKVRPGSSKFFEIYDKFLQSKREDRSDQSNSDSTIKRYEYNKTLLVEFQKYTNKKLHFNKMDEKLYNELIDYYITVKEHSQNTLSRNMGLLKTFLNWAFKNNYTYNSEFKNFRNVKKVVTDEVALTLDDVMQVYNFDFGDNKRLESARDLFVFGCATGLRFSNYSQVKRNDIIAGAINVRDVKNNDKKLSIPLNDYSKEILEKYDYKLPVISNQKFNKAIKEVFKQVGYTEFVKVSKRVGSKIKEEQLQYYMRISSHTARRTFITIMKNQKIPDKIIMGYTGHKSLETFNKYYKPNQDEKETFMRAVWKKTVKSEKKNKHA